MAKKILGKRTLAMLMSIIMVLGMININVLAAGEPELVKNYTDTYYKQDGAAGTADNWEVHLSKTAAPTRTENVYDITLKVETKDTSIQLGGATHGAVTLVLDVSNSMNYRYEGCTTCGEDEGHPAHHEYEEAYFLFFSLGVCSHCYKGESAHKDTHSYAADGDTHLENLQAAVSEFLDSYVADAQTGDKRLVSVAVFGTDAVTIQNWIDVTNASNLSSVKGLINSLKTGDGAYLGRQYLTNGGTNIEAGLVLGRNLLGDTSALAGVPVANQSLILFSDGNPTAKVKNVNDSSLTKVTYGGDDTGSQTDRDDYNDIPGILGQIAATTIAVQYNFEDEYKALTGFDRVITSTADSLTVDLEGEAGNVVTTKTVPTVITDPMGEGVTLLGTNEHYENGAWNLSGYTPVVTDGVTSYTITYQVEIDPTKVAADPQVEGYTILTPANGVTTLDYTVGEDETPVQAAFHVPDIRGKLPVFTLTVNYVDEQGKAIAEQIVENNILYGKSYETEQKEIAHYQFKALAQDSDAVSGTITADTTVTYIYTAKLYPVTYRYEGQVPANAPQVPAGGEYTYGAAVEVADAPEAEGYTFSGWDKENFEMPAEPVVITGSWTAIPKYTVTYEYINAPAGAPALPEIAEYEAGALVTVAAAAYLEGYIFSGWDKENFEMPAENVVIKGSWTIIPPDKYNVVYQYTNEIPEGAPTLPETVQYEAGAAVVVADVPELEGYTFSGWDKTDFEMPAEDVIITGSWTKLPDPKFPVSYEYINAPEGAPALPETVEYEAGTQVIVAAAPELEGYTFSGWDKENFEMPAQAVVITGSWSKNPEPKYTVSYEYINAPEGAPALPETVEYEAGASVTVADAPKLEGYTFSGWDKEDFEMPAQNVVIKGTWTKKAAPPPVVVEEAEGQFVITFDKAVAGDNYKISGEEFTFQLTDAERFNADNGRIYLGENALGGKAVYTAKNDAEGTVTITVPFVKDLSNWEATGYTATGSFVYTLSETAGNIEGMTYNQTVYTILVELTFTQQGTGWIYQIDKVSVNHTGDEQVVAQFNGETSVIKLTLGENALYTNTYDDPTPPTPPTPPAPTTGALTITKTINGKAKVSEQLGFRISGEGFEQFVLYTDFVDGTYTLGDLAAGTYTVTEENADVSGYRLKTTGEGEVEVVAGETALVEIVNTYTKRNPYPNPTPNPNPTPDPVEPTPDPVNPTPDPVEPTPDPVNPTPDPVEPTPDPVEPTPDPVEPTPDPVEPTPDPIEIPEEDVPLVEIPEEDVPLVEIPEEDVPLAEVPRTGDEIMNKILVTLLAGVGLVALVATGKKKEEN